MANYQYRLQFHKDMPDIRTPCKTWNMARSLGVSIQPEIRGAVYHLFSSLTFEELEPILVRDGVSLTYLQGQTVREDLPKLVEAGE